MTMTSAACPDASRVAPRLASGFVSRKPFGRGERRVARQRDRHRAVGIRHARQLGARPAAAAARGTVAAAAAARARDGAREDAERGRRDEVAPAEGRPDERAPDGRRRRPGVGRGGEREAGGRHGREAEGRERACSTDRTSAAERHERNHRPPMARAGGRGQWQARGEPAADDPVSDDAQRGSTCPGSPVRAATAASRPPEGSRGGPGGYAHRTPGGRGGHRPRAAPPCDARRERLRDIRAPDQTAPGGARGLRRRHPAGHLHGAAVRSGPVPRAAAARPRPRAGLPCGGRRGRRAQRRAVRGPRRRLARHGRSHPAPSRALARHARRHAAQRPRRGGAALLATTHGEHPRRAHQRRRHAARRSGRRRSDRGRRVAPRAHRASRRAAPAGGGTVSRRLRARGVLRLGAQRPRAGRMGRPAHPLARRGRGHAAAPERAARVQRSLAVRAGGLPRGPRADRARRLALLGHHARERVRRGHVDDRGADARRQRRGPAPARDRLARGRDGAGRDDRRGARRSRVDDRSRCDVRLHVGAARARHPTRRARLRGPRRAVERAPVRAGARARGRAREADRGRVHPAAQRGAALQPAQRRRRRDRVPALRAGRRVVRGAPARRWTPRRAPPLAGPRARHADRGRATRHRRPQLRPHRHPRAVCGRHGRLGDRAPRGRPPGPPRRDRRTARARPLCRTASAPAATWPPLTARSGRSRAPRPRARERTWPVSSRARAAGRLRAAVARATRAPARRPRVPRRAPPTVQPVPSRARARATRRPASRRPRTRRR